MNMYVKLTDNLVVKGHLIESAHEILQVIEKIDSKEIGIYYVCHVDNEDYPVMIGEHMAIEWTTHGYGMAQIDADFARFCRVYGLGF